MSLKSFLKFVYGKIPFKKEIFCVIKFFKTPQKKIYQHLYFNGIFTVKINAGKNFKLHHWGHIEENEIFWEGIYNGWEKKSIALWIELSKTANTILDIGANTGLYSLVAKTMNPHSVVHAFEPIPSVYNALVANITLNKFDIKSHPFALSDYDGPAVMFLPKGVDFVYSATVNENTLQNSEATKVEVEVQKLSSFISANKISSIDLVKIDVETHEVQVLNGMGDYLKKFKPTFIIEVLAENIAEELNILFKDMDYLYFNIDDKNNRIRKTDRITKSDHWNFLCCNHQTALKLKLI